MKHLFLTLSLFILSVPLFSQFSVTGTSVTTYSENRPSVSLLENVYLLGSLSGAQIKFTTKASTVRFYKYTQNFNIDRVEIFSSDQTSPDGDGNVTYTIDNLEDSKGYVAEPSGEVIKAIWIIDYNQHIPILNSLTVEETGEKCPTSLRIKVDKSDELKYYAFMKASTVEINVERKYNLEYASMEWKTDGFVDTSVSLGDQTIYDSFSITNKLPLKDTEFIMTGDKFADELGFSRQRISVPYTAVAVAPNIISVFTDESGEEVEPDDKGNYSAPLIGNFYGRSNEPTTRDYIWYIYNSKNPSDYEAYYKEQDIRYTFKQAASYRIVLYASSDGVACMDSTSIEIKIAESSLEIPNYFSPGDSPGVNDEFKVKYKSLISFKCTIFNRWGNKLYQWTDPEKGWDGKYGGKYVNPGVYFYVIDAMGSDGIRYKKGGDINILRSK